MGRCVYAAPQNSGEAGVAVFTIAQQKGGSGKTTLATNLAVGLAKVGRQVAVLDTDPQGSLGRWFMERAERGDPGMDLSTASAWGASWEVKKLGRECDDIVIDTPPKLDGDLRPAIKAADLVLVPVGPSQADVWALEAILDLCAREKKPALMVLTRVKEGTRVLGEVEGPLRGLRFPLAQARLGQRVAYAEALGGGWGVEERPGPAAAEMGELREEILAAL